MPIIETCVRCNRPFASTRHQRSCPDCDHGPYHTTCLEEHRATVCIGPEEN